MRILPTGVPPQKSSTPGSIWIPGVLFYVKILTDGTIEIHFMWILALLFLIGFEALADIFSKEYSLRGSWQYWCLAIGGYIIANAFWLFSIRKGSGLARGAVLFSVASAILAVLIGSIKYHEEIGGVESIGILVGVVAIVLIFWPDLLTLFRG